MRHLSDEQLLSYIDGNEKEVNLYKVSSHLDKCLKCINKLQELTSVSMLFEDISIQAKLRRQSRLLKNCPDIDGKRVSKEHLTKCKHCNDELKIIESLKEKPEIETKFDPAEYLPKSLRYVELLLIAHERECALREESVKTPLFEKIRSALFPRQPVLVPLSFAEKPEATGEFYKDLDDKDIVLACIQGDISAWEGLILKFTPYAFGIINHFHLHESKQDIWQDTLAILASGTIKNYNEERGKLKDFIRGIVVNLCRMKLREIKKHSGIMEEITIEYIKQTVNFDSLARFVEEQEIAQIKAVFDSLPKEFSGVLQAMLNGFGDDEIASSLNIPIDTVRSRKRRIRIKIAEMLSEKHPELSEKLKSYKWAVRNA